MTDSLYYIRHGKNYGFLPKNHLRERARGNYPFSVDIDMTDMRIDQQKREQNFLSEIVSSRLQPPSDITVNDTVSEPKAEPAPVHEENEENALPSATENRKVQSDFPVDMGAGTKSNVPSEQVRIERSAEEANDSGIDEDDDEEEDDEDDEEDSEETKKDSKEVVNEQPELIAIPPGKDEQPVAVPVAAAAPDDVPVVSDFKNVTAEEAPKIEPLPSAPDASKSDETLKVEEKVPDFIPMTTEAAKEAETILKPPQEEPPLTQDSKNETVAKPEDAPKEAPAVVEEKAKPEEIVDTPEIPKPIVDFQNDTVKEESASEEEEEKDKPEELAVEKPSEPAMITETIPESLLPVSVPPKEPEAVTQAPEVKQPEVPPKSDVQPETTPQPIVEVPSTPPPVEIPVTTEVPQIPEHLKPEFVETTPLPIQKKPEPDALLKRFNEKLGGRVVENTGRGSVEPLHRHHDHHHDHHDHSHHEEKKPEAKQEAPALPQAEKPLPPDQPEEPGFFGGLFKKFFSDEDDSEQHFQKTAKPESHLTPKTDKTGERILNQLIKGRCMRRDVIDFEFFCHCEPIFVLYFVEEKKNNNHVDCLDVFSR